MERHDGPDLAMLLNEFQKANKKFDAKTFSVFFLSMARYFHASNAALTSVCNVLVSTMSREQKTHVMALLDKEIARAQRESRLDEKFFQQVQTYLERFRQFVDKLEKSDRKKSSIPSHQGWNIDRFLEPHSLESTSTMGMQS